MSATLDLSLLSGHGEPQLEDSLAPPPLEPEFVDPVAPPPPETLAELGLPASLLEQLILKLLFSRGEMMGRDLAMALGVRFSMIDPVLDTLKRQHLASVKRALGLGAVTVVFELSDAGRAQAREHMETNQYMGAVPVPMEQYVAQIAKQKRPAGWLTPDKLANAYRRTVVTPRDSVGRLGRRWRGKIAADLRAAGQRQNVSGRGAGEPGRNVVYVPRSVLCQGNIIRVFDPVQHRKHRRRRAGDDAHRRARATTGAWVKCRRPFLISGGELTMDMLDLSFNPHFENVRGAVSDEGEQRHLHDRRFRRAGRVDGRSAEPVDRADGATDRLSDILERRQDGGAVRDVPDLFDEPEAAAVGRRGIPAPNPIQDAAAQPGTGRIHRNIQRFCAERELPYESEQLEHFLGKHYGATGKAFRRCHPRDMVTPRDRHDPV